MPNLTGVTNLKDFRLAIPLTLQEFSTKVDLSYGYVSKIERAVLMPSVYAVRKIADACGVDFGTLHFMVLKHYQETSRERGKK